MQAELKAIYDTYINSVTENRSVEDVLLAMVGDGGRYGRDVYLVPFLEQLDAFVVRCAGQPIGETEAAECVRFMLSSVHESVPPPAADGLDTADGCARHLIPLLSGAEKDAIYNMYRKKLRVRLGLPCQRRVLEALKK